MQISPETSINELLKEYPFLVEFLVAYNPQFSMLRNKVMRATVGKFATLKKVAEIGNVPLDALIKDITAEIEKHTGKSTETETRKDSEISSSGERIAKLKELILDLHRGVPFDKVKKQFDEMIADIEPTEIMSMEQQLINEGMPVEEVQRLCELHVGIMKTALDVKEPPRMPAGHPIHTLMAENEVFTKIASDLDILLQQLQINSTKFGELEKPLQEALDKLSRVEIHYQRKENQLFPYLEKHGATAPPKVMWSVHDDIRAMLKETKKAFENRDVTTFLEKCESCKQAIVDMIYKENRILFPLALELLDESEWIDIRKGEGDIGYAFEEPSVDWYGEKAVVITEEAEKEVDLMDLDTGKLTLEQVNLIMKHLPIDVTFVDENDEVRYYSAGKERIFPRSPGIIGRKVQNCHPPKSIDVVNRIIGEFKAGTKDVAEFWIQMHGRFIHIRYFAVRDDDGTFRGTLEVTQDITHIKSLEGERRLLDWDTK